jgi:hypothetical protein
VPNRNTSYESNGPDVKLRGNAQQLYEKYTALAHDASSSGERISAEAYSQFADHYFRLHQAAVGAAEARRQNDAPSEQSGQQRNKPQAESADTGDSQPEIAVRQTRLRATLARTSQLKMILLTLPRVTLPRMMPKLSS